MLELIAGLESAQAFQERKINFQNYASLLVKACIGILGDDTAMCYIVMGRQFPKMSDMGLENAAQPEMQYQLVSANQAAKQLISEIGIFHSGSVRSGIAGRVLERPHNTIIVNDSTTETRHRLLDPAVRSQLAVAITSKSLCFGAIIIEAYQADMMTQSVVRAVELLAKQTAIAIEQRPRKQRIAEKITAKLQWDQKYEQITRLYENLNTRTLASSEPIVFFWQVLHEKMLSDLGSLFNAGAWLHLEWQEGENETGFEVVASSIKGLNQDSPIALSGDIVSRLQDDAIETSAQAITGLNKFLKNSGIVSQARVFLLPVQSFFDDMMHILLFIETYKGDARSRTLDTKRLLNELLMRMGGSYNIAQYKKSQLIYDEDRNNFFEDVMHQLNTVMGSILIDTENLIDEDIPPEEHTDAFERLYELANMARAYTDSVSIAVKSRSLLEMYTQKFVRHNASELNMTVSKVANYFRGKCRSYKIQGPTVVAESFKNLPVIKLHRQLFELAMFNFLDNAVKYSFRLDSLGTRSKSLPETVPLIIEARSAEEGQFVDISISNHGIPLTKADIKVIFNRLQRSETARVHEPGGTGIGLYICNEIAKVHNGKIIVNESEPSEIVHLADKVTFTLRLPAE